MVSVASINDLLPKGYEEFLKVVKDSVDFTLKVEDERKLRYTLIEFYRLINKIIEIDKKTPFLSGEEKDFLKASAEIFFGNKKEIKYTEYYELLSKVLKSLQLRLNEIRENLLEIIKAKNLKSIELENKLLFITETMQKQLLDLKDKLTKDGIVKHNTSESWKAVNTLKKIIDNFATMVSSIITKHFKHIKEVQHSVLNIFTEDFLRLDIAAKASS